MFRCTRTMSLDIYQKRQDGGDNLDNAEVLCHQCHEANGEKGDSPADFSELTMLAVLKRAGGHCECERTEGCH